MKLASRASRPGLTVGFLRIPCNGLCTAQRFHTEGYAQMCRVGCPDEPDSLSLITTSVLCCTTCFLWSLQYGIVVMGFMVAFVHAHHQPRRNIENPGNFGDCMKERIRFMSTSTPAYAHACQVTCLTGHMRAVPRLNFRLPKPNARYPHLPNVRITTRERGNDFQGWATYTDGGTRVVDGETLAGWRAIARSPNGRIDIMVGLVITTEAHLA